MKRNTTLLTGHQPRPLLGWPVLGLLLRFFFFFFFFDFFPSFIVLSDSNSQYLAPLSFFPSLNPPLTLSIPRSFLNLPLMFLPPPPPPPPSLSLSLSLSLHFELPKPLVFSTAKRRTHFSCLRHGRRHVFST